MRQCHLNNIHFYYYYYYYTQNSLLLKIICYYLFIARRFGFPMAVGFWDVTILFPCCILHKLMNLSSQWALRLFYINCCLLKTMSTLVMDDWKLKTTPVVRLKMPNKTFVCFNIHTCSNGDGAGVKCGSADVPTCKMRMQCRVKIRILPTPVTVKYSLQ